MLSEADIKTLAVSALPAHSALRGGVEAVLTGVNNIVVKKLDDLTKRLRARTDEVDLLRGTLQLIADDPELPPKLKILAKVALDTKRA